MAENLIEARDEVDQFVGRYVREYARLELVLRIAFKQHSGLDDETYDILIGLPRTGEVTSKLQKLFPRIVTEESTRLEAARAFSQLDCLTKLRDNLVHYGGQAMSLDSVAVRCKPHQIMEATGQPFSVHTWEELKGAHEDLGLIGDFFHFHLVEKPKQAWLRKIWLDSIILPAAWRYKPPELRQRQK